MDTGTLAVRITKKVFLAILRGELKPGERILEAKMAKKLGVSPAAFREALQALKDNGLVQGAHHSQVAKPTWRDAAALLMVQFNLEPWAASKVCGKLTPAQIREFELCLARMKGAIRRKDVTTLVRVDQAIHHLVWSAPSVATLKRLAKAVLPPLTVFFCARYSQMLSENPSPAMEAIRKHHEEYGKLLAVIKAREPDEARRTFEEVIRNSSKICLSIGSQNDLPSGMALSQVPIPPEGA